MKKRIFNFLCICTVIIAFASCKKDDPVAPFSATKVSNFTAEVKSYNSANLSATIDITDNRLTDTEVGFVIAEETAPTAKNLKVKALKNGSKITASVSNLKDNTTYYARVYVKISETEYEYGSEISFTTTPMEIALKVKVNLPIDYPNATLSEIVAQFTEIISNNVIEVSGEQIVDKTFTAKLKKGTHKMVVTAKMTYKNKQGVLSEAKLELSDDINLDGSQKTVDKSITFLHIGSSSGFVIEEIFFTSTLTPEGKQYSGSGDQYVKITNNSNEVLYADGLALLESEFLTVKKWDYKPDVMNEAFAVKAIYVIPGNGMEQPVKPGESLIIANNAINHKEVNANSIDLSKADFEWYDESPNPNVQDIDNPNVPNLNKYYASTKTIHSFHNRGFTAIAIAKVPMNKEEYLSTHKYDYTYIFKFGDFVKEMSGISYKVPNKWIVDAVNLSTPKDFVWTITNPSLDAGWTYCSEEDRDKTRYGLAVRRKIDNEANGRKYFKDTNNSTNDFETRVKPSLMK